MMKGTLPRYLGSVAVILGLVLGLAGAVAARDLAPQEEKTLFSLNDLGPVDLAVKTVTVEVYVSLDPQLDDCRRMLAQVWGQVQAFWRRGSAWSIFETRRAWLRPAACRLELLADEVAKQSYEAFNVCPPSGCLPAGLLNKCAFAHLPLSVVHISFKRFKNSEFSSDPQEAPLNQNWLANLFIHELGHLLGLYHYHEFTDDPVAKAPRERGRPNFMGQKIAFKPVLGASEAQRRLLHSYLGKGKVYQQYQQVDFDPLRYLELVKLHNLHEPAQGDKMAQGAEEENQDLRRLG
jgi:hypothetical protein